MLAADQHAALKLLAAAAHGCTIPFLLDSGCSVASLRHLMRQRLVIADRVRASREPKCGTIVRFRISKAGRQALQAGRHTRHKNLVKLTILVLFVTGMVAGMYVGHSCFHTPKNSPGQPLQHSRDL
jgi:hypothetical protein